MSKRRSRANHYTGAQRSQQDIMLHAIVARLSATAARPRKRKRARRKR